MAVGKRLRFEILKRDGFRCVYCGATPKKARLRVDHVVPRARGGGDEPANLVTACFDCNSGKSDVELHEQRGDVAAPVDDVLARARAARALAEERAADAAVTDELVCRLRERWQSIVSRTVPRQVEGALRRLVHEFSEVELEEALVATGWKDLDWSSRPRYFFGVLRNIRQRRERSEMSEDDLANLFETRVSDGVAAVDREDWAAGVRALGEARQIQHLSPMDEFDYGRALLGVERYQGAAEVFGALDVPEPDDAFGWAARANLGIALWRLGREDEALEIFDAVSKQHVHEGARARCDARRAEIRQRRATAEAARFQQLRRRLISQSRMARKEALLDAGYDLQADLDSAVFSALRGETRPVTMRDVRQRPAVVAVGSLWSLRAGDMTSHLLRALRRAGWAAVGWANGAGRPCSEHSSPKVRLWARIPLALAEAS